MFQCGLALKTYMFRLMRCVEGGVGGDGVFNRVMWMNKKVEMVCMLGSPRRQRGWCG